ncbi:hypothetical protein [Acrocarpospora catenulata]|uniref:hypothetical protein n=1 Tax=Acrocarpospora catenulata TaxID=2836182 RepID=UPI001BD9521F|nr:hypothetical protein [Acrocarpospora catenulata]
MDDSTTEATTVTEQVADVDGTPQFENDAERWKYFSRVNENRWKKATADLEAATAKVAELEQIISQRREQDTLTQIRTIASERGVELDDEAMAALNLTAFVTEAGEIDSAALTGFLSRFGPTRPKFAQNLGIGPQGRNGSSRPSIPLDARQRR